MAKIEKAVRGRTVVPVMKALVDCPHEGLVLEHLAEQTRRPLRAVVDASRRLLDKGLVSRRRHFGRMIYFVTNDGLRASISVTMGWSKKGA